MPILMVETSTVQAGNLTILHDCRLERPSLSTVGVCWGCNGALVKNETPRMVHLQSVCGAG